MKPVKNTGRVVARARGSAVPLRIQYAQAPSAGLAANSVTDCQVVVFDGATPQLTGDTVAIHNWGGSEENIATEGRRLLQHLGGELVGWDCEDTGDPDAIGTVTPGGGTPPSLPVTGPV